VGLLKKETSMAMPKRRAVKAWSKQDVKNLRTLAKAKLSAGRAAKKLRRTRDAGRGSAEGDETGDSFSID
jgi:hypothetical protein